MNTIPTLKSKVEIGSLKDSSLSTLVANYKKVIVLVDENTKALISRISTLSTFSSLDYIEIKSGEKNKNLETCQYIWSQLIEFNIDRNGLIINLGGGVITDMGAFAASTYKRGIDFINIPTSLLSMVDASVGGKTGVNFQGIKNNIGLFIEPKSVYCDTSLLETLPQRELISGIGEILKHALITDLNYWQTLIETSLALWNWESIINKSISIKNTIVLKDPLEKNDRKKLNFGHTIGHAIESNKLNNNEPILHGEAVAIGMICESYISNIENTLSEKELQEITTIIKSIFKLPSISSDDSTLLNLMLQDKKNEGLEINFTLLDSIGKSSINHYIRKEIITDALAYYRKLIQ